MKTRNPLASFQRYVFEWPDVVIPFYNLSKDQITGATIRSK